MADEQPDRDAKWKDLCKAAQNETDPAKLMQLVEEINGELEKREAQKKGRADPR
jgi:hypothetical protein